ncbi:MAG: squalene/phytoene synthase family protein [Bdellovibrionales bacterium]
MEPIDFYQDHLDRVSRSFAFCIRQLPMPLRHWVSLSYLMCRTLDTIEDSAWPDFSGQMKAFEVFDRALASRETQNDLSQVLHPILHQVVDGERLLLQDVDRLMADLKDLPESVSQLVCDLLLSMSSGMQHFIGRHPGAKLQLRSLGEVNQYCFFVAGVVGELLARLVAKVEPRFSLSPLTLLRAHHFGLFLQKVNILKDQVGDESAGRRFVPSRELVEKSSIENAQNALQFLLDIPKEQSEFRRFCAWSLFLGMESITVARRSVAENQVLKVSRSRTDELLRQVEEDLSDNSRLKTLFLSLMSTLGWSWKDVPANSSPSAPKWLIERYRGPLEAPQIGQLGVASSV